MDPNDGGQTAFSGQNSSHGQPTRGTNPLSGSTGSTNHPTYLTSPAGPVYSASSTSPTNPTANPAAPTISRTFSNQQASSQSSDARQRQTAAEIARRRVLAAYGDTTDATTRTAIYSGPGSATTSPANSSFAATFAGASSATASNSANTPNSMNNFSAATSTPTNNPATTSPTPTTSSAIAPISVAGTTAVANGAHLKNQPAPAKVTSEDLRKYHSAWQNYYQKYYSEYYAQAARTYVETERLRDARKMAEEEDALRSIGRMSGRRGQAAKARETQPETAQNSLPNTSSASSTSAAASSENAVAEDVGAKLRQNIREKAVSSAKKSRRRKRWIPVILGVVVVLFVLFMQYNRLIFAPIFAYMSPGGSPATEIEPLDPTITQAVSPEPRLIIPKINVDVPVTFGIPVSDVMSAMNSGVAHYRIAGASAYPGEVGNTVITGHSAGDVYSSNPYKYIFSGLERLEEGDLIYVNYESVRYTYQITKKQVVEPTNVAALVIDTDVPMLTLVTCTPLGTSRYRLLVFANQISPSADGSGLTSTEQTPIEHEDNNEDDASLPSNEPSFFEKIWGFLTGS